MHLGAEKIGWGVPVTFEATVHSLFRNAAILTVAGHQLVTLVPATAGGLPGAISIALPAGFEFSKALGARSRAAVRGGMLRFRGGALSVDLRDAVRWRSGLDALELDLNKPAMHRAWEDAAAILAADGRTDAFVRIACAPIRALSEAASALDITGANHAMASLVGLGAGGTPAGDDFLVGFLAGLHATEIALKRQAFLAALGGEIRALLARTNDVSRVYLAAAAEGEVSERLTDVAAAIARGGGAPIVAGVAKAAIVVGHTSGADGTLGLLLGTAAWGPKAVARAGITLTNVPVVL